MIKGKRRVELSAYEILSRISYYDIYRKYVGNFPLNDAICNPFREDNTPSFIIGNRYGEIIHTDFADPYWRGNAIQLVEQIHGCSYNEALKIIDRDFNLGIISGELGEEYKKITSVYKQPENLGKRYSLIQATTKKFTKKELKYWEAYYQGLDDLKSEKVYSISKLFLNKKKYVLTNNEFVFGYLHKGGYWKIYRPFEDKKKKWISNVPITTACGLENLDANCNALIAKSKKDYMVCKKVYEYVCHVQNESLVSFSDETVSYIQDNSVVAYYGGDSDEAGKKASYAITEAFNFRHINPPDRFLPKINDFADWGRDYGLDALKQHFIKKGLMK